MRELMLTENVKIQVDGSRFGTTAWITGGFTDHAPYGWALVIGDRLVKRRVEPRIQVEEGGKAIITLNGVAPEVMWECIREVE